MAGVNTLMVRQSSLGAVAVALPKKFSRKVMVAFGSAVMGGVGPDCWMQEKPKAAADFPSLAWYGPMG